MLPTLQPHFVAAGHVSFDVNVEPDGRESRPEPGGAVMYGARVAVEMGYHVGVVTVSADDYPFGRVGTGVTVRRRRTDHTTTFRATHEGAKRDHRLLANAGPMTADDVPADWRRPEILLLGPLAGELPAGCVSWFEPQLTCAVAQGWMRRWDDEGNEFIDPAPPPGLTGLDIVVISDSEVPGELIEAWEESCRILAVTHAEQGVSIYEHGRSTEVAGFPVEAVDPTGAGDVWAAAFSVRLSESDDVAESARFANAAASLCVEQTGLSGVPNRGAVEWRMSGRAGS